MYTTHTYQDGLSVSAETGKEGQWTVAKRQESAGTYSMWTFACLEQTVPHVRIQQDELANWWSECRLLRKFGGPLCWRYRSLCALADFRSMGPICWESWEDGLHDMGVEGFKSLPSDLYWDPSTHHPFATKDLICRGRGMTSVTFSALAETHCS